MHSIFNLDSKFMQAMSRLGDLMLLNFYFLLTSIPIVTIGASLSALYTVTFRFGTDREEGTTKSYFRAFWRNLKEATLLWLLVLPILGACLFSLIVTYAAQGWMHYLWPLYLVLSLLAVFILSYGFPLVSQFENKTMTTFKNALLLSIAYLPRSLAMAFLNALPFALIMLDLYLFMQCGFIWFILYFSIAAYLITRLLKKPFKPFLEPEEEEKKEEEAPALPEETE